jgi:ZIP family zinc transporter
MNAFLWGLVATSSLVIGGIIASRFSLSKRALGIIMAFGAGTLISAVSYELIFEAVKLAKGTGFPAFGLFAGALTFYLCEWLIEKYGAKNKMGIETSNSSGLVIPMILAIILDGVPESIVIGLGVFEKGTVSLAMLVAVFISNLPEAIAGTTGMKAGGWKRSNIILLWLFIAIICALASVAGYFLFSNASAEWLSFIQAFAGGAILIVLANSMMPESFEHGGKLAGIFTVLGFSVSVCVIILEYSRM